MSRVLKRDFLVFILVFGVLTLPFLIFPELDIILQKPYYTVKAGWFMADRVFWDMVYKYGIFVGYFAAIVALFVVSLSYSRRNMYKWRKAAFLMLFVTAIGPGVLVNGTFKEHWGRPRPYEIEEFNGNEQFVMVWKKGDTDCKSFPCGHASMGFVLAIPFLFLRQRHKKAAWLFFILGTLYGLLIGYTRMVAGGHFASDVIWSAGMVWFTAIVGFHLFKVGKTVDESLFDDASQKRKGRIVKVIMGFVLPALTVSLFLATPYISKKECTINSSDLNRVGMETLTADLPEGNITVSFDSVFQAKYAVNAFGFPNSKVRWTWDEDINSRYWLEYTGFFTEVRNNVEIKYPNNSSWQNILKVGDGDIFLTIPNDTIERNLKLVVVSGDVVLNTNSSGNIDIITSVKDIEDKNGVIPNSNKGGRTKLEIDIKEGKLIVQ